jgi:hypothetical protein
MKRAVHIDFHTMPGIHDFNRDWDAAVFAQRLKDAHVDYINAFARCNIGFAYYPTQVGIPYPGMKDDMFGDLLRECHRREIGVSAYINVGLDHEQSSRHMGWLRLDREGRVIRGDRTGNFFRTLCYNNPEYRAYHFGMLREICAYDLDGLFFDCMVTEPCFCYHCRTKMLAAGLDPDDAAVNARFQEQSMVDFSEESRDLIGPDKYLYLNGMHYGRVKHLDTHIEIECLPSSWGYDFFWPAVSYARNLQDKVLYMTGRFQKSWADFGGFKTKASLEYDYHDALCAGIDVSVGDHMHPAGNLEPAVYRVIGQLNEQILAYEPYTAKARYVSDIGVLVNAERDFDHGQLNGGSFISDSTKGMSRMFGELRQSYDIVDETMALDRFKVLVLPDTLRMNDVIQAKLACYVGQGGKILATGTAGLTAAQDGFALPDTDLVFDGLETRQSSYFHFEASDDPLVYEMDTCMYSQVGTRFHGGTQLARTVQAYFDRHWDGFHGYFYLPPEKTAPYAAAAVNMTGNLARISFDVFRAYYDTASYPLKALVSQCLAVLLPQPLLKTVGLPSTARATVTSAPDYDLLHIKVTFPEVRGKMDIIEEHVTLPAGAVVLVRGAYRDARLLPDGRNLPICADAGYTRVVLPDITGYQMIKLDR